jgi:hypothetical protein
MSNKINKEKNREIRDKIALEKEIEENPDWCFCGELLGLEPDVNFDSDEIIGHTEPINGFPYHNSIGYTLPIYICKRCSKKTSQSIVY